MAADEPLEGEVLDAEPELDPHALYVSPTRYGRLARCRCHRWDGWWNGPASERYVREDHARHVERSRVAEEATR